jgi:DnaJ-class molecular chaperone
MVSPKEYYTILGVKRGAAQDAIQAGYRRMALKWHPQRNPNNLELAMSQFALVAEAYDVLSDAQKKSIYDEYGLKVFEEGMLSFPGYQFVGDPLQQFNKFFASDSSFVPLTQGESLLGMKVREPPREKEEDLKLDLEVTLEELYAGATRVVQYARTRLADNRVSTIEEATTITVEVVPGWANGTVVTFKGMGHQLNAGTQKGDVKLTVITKPHAHFVRRGVDLVYTHKLGLSQALVGHTLEVTLLNGHTIAVPVPEITTSKDEKRIAGRGMPKGSKGPGYGDLIIAFDIGFPKELSGAQKEAIRQIIGA